MDDNIEIKSSGVGIGVILGVVFIVLKLLGHITWSWWWVLAPFWIPVGIVILVLIVVFSVAIFHR